MRRSAYLFGFLMMTLNACKEKSGAAGKCDPVLNKYEMQIDTTSILTREQLLSAAAALRRIQESYQSDTAAADRERGKYYRILKFRTFLHQRMARMLDTIPGDERLSFLKQFRALMAE